MMRHKSHYPQSLSQEYYKSNFWYSKTLPDYVYGQARKAPNKLAVVDSSGRYTYNQLAELTTEFAYAFADLGVDPGDPVIVCLPTIKVFVPIMLAIERLGAIVVNTLPTLGEREMRHLIHLIEPVCVVTLREHRSHRPLAMIQDVLSDRRSKIPVIAVDLATEAGDEGVRNHTTSLATLQARGRSLVGGPLRCPTDPDQICNATLTTGTSGRPKAVLHTHNTSLAAIRSTLKKQRLGSADIFHAGLPVGHTFGYFYGVRMALLAGGCLVMQRGWDPEEMFQLSRQMPITHSAGTPTYLSDILAADGALQELKALKVFTCAGAKLEAELASLALQELPGRVSVAYGMSEAGHVASIGPDDDPAESFGTCGRVHRETSMQVGPQPSTIDSDGPVEGELTIIGPSVFAGYLVDESGSGPRMNDSFGKHLTGDIGCLTDRGFLKIKGRVGSATISRGGEKIPIGEVEGVLRDMTDIREIVLVGIPNERLGQQCAAVIEQRPGINLSLDDLKSFLTARGVTRAFWPEVVLFTEALPRNEVGKLSRAEIANFAVEQLGLNSI